MICLNSQTALDEAFPRVGDRGLFSTFLDLRLRGSVLYLVGSSFQIIWDERVEAPPAVGATTPPLLDGYFPSIRLLVIFAKLLSIPYFTSSWVSDRLSKYSVVCGFANAVHELLCFFK